jgi:hypothetical protein
MTLDQIINNLCLLQGFTASAGKPETSKLVGAAIAALTNCRDLLDKIIEESNEFNDVVNEAGDILCQEHPR